MKLTILAALVSCASAQKPSLLTCEERDQKAIASLAPAVGALLEGQSPDWERELDFLKGFAGAPALECAVDAFQEPFAMPSHPDAVRPLVIKTKTRTTNAALYLNRH